MSIQSGETITAMLQQWRQGDAAVLDRLMPILYRELRRLAAERMQHERPGHTLQATALVHEAYVRLAELHDIQWRDRSHFIAIAARTMRRVLVDHARSQRAEKRGGDAVHITLAEMNQPVAQHEIDVVELDAVLTRLADIDNQQVRVVELRYFASLTIDEIAGVLEISPATVKRKWTIARAWLYRELQS